MGVGFELFNFWDIIPSCGFSNHFFFMIWNLKTHGVLWFVNFLCLYASFFTHGFVLFSILCFGLGFLFCVGESYFESPKVNCWILFHSKSLFFYAFELLWHMLWVQALFVNIAWDGRVLFWLCVYNITWEFKP
jgi:hypothetical protein